MKNEKNIKITAALAKAAFQVDFSEAPNDIEYMPAGVHQVCCSKNGKPVEMTLTVDEKLADVYILRQALYKVLCPPCVSVQSVYKIYVIP